MIKKNKLTRAEFLIFKYVEELLTELGALISPDLEGFVNMPSHELNKQELIRLLQKMFDSQNLVAYQEGRGYFSPTLSEIEAALNEPSAFSRRSKNTFYGYVSCASERYYELKAIWEKELSDGKSK